MPDFQAASAASTAPDLPGRCALLSDYALFRATGSDAATFLHGQLTNDVTALDASNARLAGFCTAKGRLLATMAIWRSVGTERAADDPGTGSAYVGDHRDDPDTDEVHIMGFMRRSLAETVIKRLRMFVLRAKVTFDSPALQLQGVWVDARHLGALSEAAGGDLPTTAWKRVTLPSGTWIAAPHDATTLRWWWLASPVPSAQAAHALSSVLGQGEQSEWHQHDVTQGLPWIEAGTQDLFIPQTVNLDLIDGVSFTKGCYPGQEIVARSHYLGKVKRRMTLGSLASPPDDAALAGADVFEAGDAGEPCGRIINAATHQGVTSVLLETTLTAMTRPELRLGAANGPIIALRALPYALA